MADLKPKPASLHPSMGVGFSLDEATYLRNLVLVHQKHVAEAKDLAREVQQDNLRHMKVVLDKLDRLVADATAAQGPKS